MIMDSAAYANVESIKLLLSKGANPNEKNNEGETAIIIARKKGVSNNELENLLNVCPTNTPINKIWPVSNATLSETLN